MTDVTEAMIEAGVDAVMASVGSTTRERVRAIYLAMTTARECVDQVEGVALPCPFCSSSKVCFQNGYIKQPDGDGWYQFVWCETCGAQSRECLTEAEAAAFWNTRAALSTRSQSPDVEAILWRNRCQHLLSVIDSCDEAEAPSCEMEPEDVAGIDEARKALGDAQ